MSLDLDIPVAEVFEPLILPARYKGAWGGRGSGKSHFFAGLAVFKCVHTPGQRILCVREVQKSLRDSAKRLIEDKIREFQVPGFEILDKVIRTPGVEAVPAAAGGAAVALGAAVTAGATLARSAPTAHRTPRSTKL